MMTNETSRDPEIREEIRVLYEAALQAAVEKGEQNAPSWGPMFDRALEWGASVDLLHQVACEYTDNGLPYVGKLLKAGWTKEQVLYFVLRQCFEGTGHPYDRELSHDHRINFRRDASAWQLFETIEQLSAFAQSMAEADPADTIQTFNTIAYYFGRLRRPDLQPLTVSPWMTNRDEAEQREQEIINAGRQDTEPIMVTAANRLEHVTAEFQVQILKTLPSATQVRTACRLSINHHSLSFIGWVLGKHNLSRQDDGNLKYAIMRYVDEHPQRTAVVYRWLLEGVTQANAVPRLRMSSFNTELRGSIEYQGWKFMRLESRENPRRPGQRDLQVVLDIDGKRIIVKHDSRSTYPSRGDHLKEGDEVIVPVKSLQNIKPVYEQGRIRIYQLALHPVMPLTYEMKKDPKLFFFIAKPGPCA